MAEAWESAPLADATPAWMSAPKADATPAWMSAPKVNALQPSIDDTLDAVAPHLKVPVGAAESAVSMGTNLLSTVAAVPAAEAGALYEKYMHGADGPETFSGLFNAIINAGTYQPRTEQGQAMNAGLGAVMDKVGQAAAVTGQAFADEPMLGQAGPAVGAVLKGGITAAPLALGLRAKLPEGARVAEVTKPIEPMANLYADDVAPVITPERVQTALTAAKDADVPAEHVQAAVESATSPEEAVLALEKLSEKPAAPTEDTPAPAVLPDTPSADVAPPVEATPTSVAPEAGLGGKQGGAISTAPLEAVVDAAKRIGKRGAKGAEQLYSAVADEMWHRSISRIRDLDTPTARTLANEFKPDTGVERGLIEHIQAKTGELTTRLDKIFEPLRGRRRIPKADQDHLMRMLRGEDGPARLLDKAKELRAYLDDAYQYATDAKVPIEYRRNYVSQVWDVNPIRKDPEGAAAFFASLPDMSPQAGAGVVRNLIDNEGIYSRDSTSDRFAGSDNDFPMWASRQQKALGGASKIAAEKARVLQIPPEKLREAEKWLVNDLEAVLSRYTHALVQRTEYARLAGPNEGRLNNMVAQILREIQEPTMDYSHYARQIYDVADAAQHKFTYFPVLKAKFPTVLRVMRIASNYEVITKMAKVALASLPEFAAPMIQFGARPASYAAGVKYAAISAARAADKLITGKHHIPQDAAAEFLERLGVIYVDSLRSAQMERFGGTTSKFATRFMHYTGLEQLTNVQRIVASDAIVRMVDRYSKELTRDTLAEGRRTYYTRILDELGIPADAAVAWAKSGDNAAFQPYIDTAVIRGVKMTIVTPDPMSVPMAYNDPFLQLPLIFNRFNAVMTNSFLKRFGKELLAKDTPVTRKAVALGGMATAISIGSFVLWLKAQWLNSDFAKKAYDQQSTAEHLWAGMESAYYPLPLRTAETVLGKYPGQKQKSKGDLAGDIAEAVGGAPIGDAVKILHAAKFGNAKEKAKTAAELTPLFNVGPLRGETQDFLQRHVFQPGGLL